MDQETLQRIVSSIQALALEASDKRKSFKGNNNSLFEQSMGESVGIGKCLDVLVTEFPDQMALITEE